MTPSPGISLELRQKIQPVRDLLLRLHKLLLDREKAAYESEYGPILSAAEFLNLVLNHAHFEWLRQLSGMIVQIDEILAPRSVAGEEEALSAFKGVALLLTPDENGAVFARAYWQAIQDSPDVVLLHRELRRMLD